MSNNIQEHNIEYELFYYSAPPQIRVYLPNDLFESESDWIMHLSNRITRLNPFLMMAKKLYWDFRGMNGLIEQNWIYDDEEFPIKYFAQYKLKMFKSDNNAVVRLLPLREPDGSVVKNYYLSELRPWNSRTIEEDRELGYFDNVD
jgi:hypothetical protein